MPNFSEVGEARALTGLVESRIDPSQSPAEKRTEEGAIARELNSLSPQDLQDTMTAFTKMNKGGWHELGATLHKNAAGEVSSIEFTPRGYMRGNSEDFEVKLK